MRTSGDHSDDSIIKIGLINEKYPGDLRRLAVTQTLVAIYRLTLEWKHLKEQNNKAKWSSKEKNAGTRRDKNEKAT